MKRSEPVGWTVLLKAGDHRTWGNWRYVTKEEAAERGKLYGCPFEVVGICNLEYGIVDKLIDLIDLIDWAIMRLRGRGREKE